MTSTMRGEQASLGIVVTALALGLALAPAQAQEKATEPQAMREAPSHSLSAKQQAIPLIASFMAASEMPKLNAAFIRGWMRG